MPVVLLPTVAAAAAAVVVIKIVAGCHHVNSRNGMLTLKEAAVFCLIPIHCMAYSVPKTNEKKNSCLAYAERKHKTFEILTILLTVMLIHLYLLLIVSFPSSSFSVFCFALLYCLLVSLLACIFITLLYVIFVSFVLFHTHAHGERETHSLQ